MLLHIPALMTNTMPADVLAPKVARASTSTVMAVQNIQHILCVPELICSTWDKTNQDTIQNVNVPSVLKS